jgi:hypothetical protein
MLRLDKVIKPWKESAALNDHINLYGFWNETAFLTKSGDVGMVLRVSGVDYESLDHSEQEYAAKRLEAALKAFGPGFHLYQYLFKSNRPEIPFATYEDPVVEAAIDQRRQFFEAKRDRLYQVEIFYTSFTLQDISSTSDSPDLKVIIEPADHSSIVAASGPPQFVPAAQLEQSRGQLAALQSHLAQAVDEYKSTYPLELKFDYTFKADESPFDIQSIYHDDKFTYIKTNAPEKFSVYEIRDGKPNLVNYELRDNTYIIPKVMDSGYVELGKKRMDFTRKG